MNIARSSVIYAIIGMLAGYAAWIAAGTLILATTPVHAWVLAGALELAALTLGAVFIAVRHKRSPAAVAFWAAPLLPIVASLYLLVVVST